MEPASAAAAGKKATGIGGNNSRGGGDDNAAPSSHGRPALADLINGTGVFAQENNSEQQLLEQQEAPPTKRQRTLWPTPGAAAAGGGLQVRSGRIAVARERIRIARLALPAVFFSLLRTSIRREDGCLERLKEERAREKGSKEREKRRKRVRRKPLSRPRPSQPTKKNSTSLLSSLSLFSGCFLPGPHHAAGPRSREHQRQRVDLGSFPDARSRER